MMDETALFPDFEPQCNGAFLARHGRGKKTDVAFSNKKLCFVSTDQTLLVELLLELSERPDCYFVKFSTKPKAGMYLGRCFLMDDETVGKLWQRYKVHPRLMCTIQDDDFTLSFRDLPD